MRSCEKYSERREENNQPGPRSPGLTSPDLPGKTLVLAALESHSFLLSGAGKFLFSQQELKKLIEGIKYDWNFKAFFWSNASHFQANCRPASPNQHWNLAVLRFSRPKKRKIPMQICIPEAKIKSAILHF